MTVITSRSLPIGGVVLLRTPHETGPRADLRVMSAVVVDSPLASSAEQPTDAGRTSVPCAARPSTGFWHLDGPCRCFFGGPAPEFVPLHTELAHAS